jgi:hypothetical protein
MNRTNLAKFLFFVFSTVNVCGQIPPVGTIDFYGLRTVSENQVREKLGLKEGDAVPGSKAEKTEIEKRVESLPNVIEARVNAVCCNTDGKTMLYMGIRERGIPALKFHAAPNGTMRLPNEIVKLGKDFSDAHHRAVLKGDAGEDTYEGHSLMKNVEARAVQQKFIPAASQHINLLRRVLRESGDAEHRSIAATIIAYYKNKAEIVGDLVYATKDPDGTVRNNAVRALGLIAGYSAAHPEKNIEVPFEAFVEMLNSIEWTDRNKSSMVLSELTEKRNVKLFELLRRKAVPSLIEMARWKNRGHAGMPFFILGRVAGFSDEEIGRALMTDKREGLIINAQKRLPMLSDY